MRLFVLLALTLCASLQTLASAAFTLSKLNHFAKLPVSDSPTTRTPQEAIHTGGRLIERHVQYVAEAGYRSYLSIADFPTNDTLFNGVSGLFPSTQYEMSLARAYNLQAEALPSEMTVSSVRAISELISSLPKPLYVHCFVGYTATLFVQLHYFLTGQIKDAQEIYAHSLALGYDYQSNPSAVRLINEVTGRSDEAQAETIEQNLAQGEYSYKYFFWTHRLGNSDAFYNAGQLLSTHMAAIQTAGYKSVISFRPNGEPTVRTSTDPKTGSVENFEFSDEHGDYSVALEEKEVRRAGLLFFYLPLVSGGADTWSRKTFDNYAPILSAAMSHGAALVHCASGYRASAFTLTYLASQQKQCVAWVVDRAAEVGFDLSTDKQVLAFAKDILGC